MCRILEMIAMTGANEYLQQESGDARKLGDALRWSGINKRGLLNKVHRW
ncbi:MAG: hypothetical protein V3U87_14590 [Methylococcaceae bacterium]